MSEAKQQVRDFWEAASCGETLYLKELTREAYEEQSLIRYSLEPFILDFAEFGCYAKKRVLEIGLGLGADHQKFAEAGADIEGVDLTARAVEHVQRRFAEFKLPCKVAIGDAENLPFPNDSFDLVWTWGVIHHSPSTIKALQEIWRVLKPGCECKVMIYHKYAMVGYMLWLRYALFRFRPLTTLAEIYSNYLESPGTKAYTISEARNMFLQSGFENLRIDTLLTHGDLLTSSAGQRHQGIFLNVARIIWPRWLIKTFLKSHGLFMTIRARKPLR